MSSSFAPRGNAAEIEEGLALAPKFDAAGFLTCVVMDADSGQLLMVAHMNAEALTKTIETTEAHYWSRSRQNLWKKGVESGHVQHVVEMRVDCDQDAILIKVRVDGTGASCHTGRISCFYRTIPLGKVPTPELELSFADAEQLFDPAEVYRHTSG